MSHFFWKGEIEIEFERELEGDLEIEQELGREYWNHFYE